MHIRAGDPQLPAGAVRSYEVSLAEEEPKWAEKVIDQKYGADELGWRIRCALVPIEGK